MFRFDSKFDFMGRRRIAYAASLLLVLASLVLLFTRGLNLGIDFTGGTVIEVGYTQPKQLDEVRSALSDAGYDRAVVQHFGTSQDVLIRLAPREGEDRAQVADQVFGVLQAQVGAGGVELRRVEFVGPQVGEELREAGGLAFIVALGGILLYVWVRFVHWAFSVGSVVALVHDAVITLGYFSLTGLEFDLTTLFRLSVCGTSSPA